MQTERTKEIWIELHAQGDIVHYIEGGGQSVERIKNRSPASKFLGTVPEEKAAETALAIRAALTNGTLKIDKPATYAEFFEKHPPSSESPSP